jgi:hypothetical protein
MPPLQKHKCSVKKHLGGCSIGGHYETSILEQSNSILQVVPFELWVQGKKQLLYENCVSTSSSIKSKSFPHVSLAQGFGMRSNYNLGYFLFTSICSHNSRMICLAMLPQSWGG